MAPVYTRRVVLVTRNRKTMVDWASLALRCLTLGAAGTVAGCGESGAPCDPFADVAVIQCPGSYALLVVPDQASVGGSVSLTATIVSGMDAGAPVFSWSAPSGTFANAGAPATSFTCTVPGTIPVTFTAKRPRCSETLSASVNCVAAADGGDGSDANAALDAGAGDGADVGTDGADGGD
jgi:hypothetical protein